VSTTTTWGGPADMSAWEALMWRAESDPRTRSTGILLEILEGEPEWDRFLAGHERTTGRIPRLRERVIEPLLPVVQPAWAPDPHFDLAHHVHRMHLSGPGTHEQLLALCESLFRRPLDRARPPWEAVLVTGLEHGRAAYLLKFHHSLTDGLGLIQLLTLAHSTTPEPGSGEAGPGDAGTSAPEGIPLTPAGLLTSRIRSRVAGAPAYTLRQSASAVGRLARGLRRPDEALSSGLGFAASLRRMLAPPEAGRSPLLSGNGLGNRLLTVDFSLDRLRAGGKAAGGSVNDAFIAAVLGGMRRYHEHHDALVDVLPIGIPVSLRNDNDPLGGNRFAGARFAAPLAEPDPAVRIQLIREFVMAAREEPAIGFLDYVSPVLTKLPTAAIVELSAGLTGTSDLQVSNIRGIGHPVYLAGVKVLGMYPLGPRPGVAGMVAMITYDGTCCLGLNVDPDVFQDGDVLTRCLEEGFAEVAELAEGADGTGRSGAGG
jgi:diacylglycerol O-acyltransferase